MLALGALGVVYGDIGTSPLYTIKTAVDWSGGHFSPEAALGMLSLIVWTLVIVTSVKYVAVIMRADNDGEGGILALMSLLGVKHGRRPAIIAMGMLGAALLFGDGAITPAISVLSALEGLKGVDPAITPYIVPLSVVVLIALFGIQPQGTGRISKFFGPVMALWFAVIGVLGLIAVLRHPHVLWALDPIIGLRYLFGHGLTGFLVLGAVFLCATGAEALYADMGHFGATPIRLAWYGLVFPALILSYAGQTALLIDSAPAQGSNPFYDLCPASLQVPLVALATIATVIASQSIITGAYSMTRQAIQLGLLPRVRISQTSAQSYGQIYVGLVNWALMALTLVLTVTFRSSDNLAAAFGVAVSLTMLLTSLLMYRRHARGLALEPAAEPRRRRLFHLRGRLLRDRQFRQVLRRRLDSDHRRQLPLLPDDELERGLCGDARRIGARYLPDLRLSSGNSMTRRACPARRSISPAGPMSCRWPCCTISSTTRSSIKGSSCSMWRRRRFPGSTATKRLHLADLPDDFHSMTVRFGFMEHPNIPRVLERQQGEGVMTFNIMDTSFFVGRLTIMPTGRFGWRRIKMNVFKFMHRNALSATEFFRIPAGRVVELGGQLEV